jgi:MscS family membrane protein
MVLESIAQWLKVTLPHAWIIEATLIIIATIVLQMLEICLYRRLLPRLLASKSYWDDAFLRSVHKPAVLFIWITALSSLLELLSHYATSSQLLRQIPQWRSLTLLLLTLWFLVRFVRNTEAAYLTPKPGQTPSDPTTVHAVGKIVVAITIIIGMLIGMQLLHVPISGLLAFGGIGGVGVAFAAKDLLGNLFGGVMIFLDRPFAVGERISSNSPQFDGVVEQIGWRSTRIRTLDKRALYIPNGTFATICIENPSRMTNRRINTKVGVRYDDASKLETIVASIDSMLNNHPQLDPSLVNFARFSEFGPSSLNITINAYTKTIDWLIFQDIQQQIFLKILGIIDQHGAECAFPTQTLYVTDNSST